MATHKTARARSAFSALALCASLIVTSPMAHAEPSTKPAAEGTKKSRPPGRSTAKRKRAPKEAPPAPADAPPVPPLASESLERSARLLLDAIARGEPALADPFFFPEKPFLDLKDVDDPAKYHRELVRAYHQNIKDLHARRRSWEGVTFVSFELGSAPRWTPPGHEWNKLGYYRTFDARLTYEVSGRKRTFVVRTIISWEGEWYVTHLSPVKH